MTLCLLHKKEREGKARKDNQEKREEEEEEVERKRREIAFVRKSGSRGLLGLPSFLPRELPGCLWRSFPTAGQFREFQVAFIVEPELGDSLVAASRHACSIAIQDLLCSICSGQALPITVGTVPDELQRTSTSFAHLLRVETERIIQSFSLGRWKSAVPLLCGNQMTHFLFCRKGHKFLWLYVFSA